MNTVELDKHFDEWLATKEREGYIKNVCGMTGLIAVISFMDYIKENAHAGNNIDSSSDQGNKTHHRRSRIEPRDLSKA